VKVFKFAQSLILPVSLDEAWAFFSNPANLEKITPPEMGFETISGNEFPMKVGQEVAHRVRLAPLIWITWVSRIESIEKGEERAFFSDRQLKGPYAYWKHTHHFLEVDAGVEMKDEIEYSIFPNVLSPLINQLYIRKKLETTFTLRNQMTMDYFQEEK